MEPHKSNNPAPTLPFGKGEGEEFVRLGGFFGFFMLAPDFSRVIQNINHKSPTVSTVCGDTEKTEKIVIKLKNPNPAPDHGTNSPSQRGPGELAVHSSFAIHHSSFIILSGCVGCSFIIHHSPFTIHPPLPLPYRTTPMIGLTSRMTDLTSRMIDAAMPMIGVTTRMIDAATRMIGITSRMIGVTSRMTDVTSRMIDLTKRMTGVTSPMIDLTSPMTDVTTRMIGVTTPMIDAATRMIGAASCFLDAAALRIENFISPDLYKMDFPKNYQSGIQENSLKQISKKRRRV
jgi:hypothetical protein